MDGSTPGDTESDTCPIARQEEILHKRDTRFRTVVADLQVPFEDEFDGVITEDAEAGAGIRRQGRFDSVNQGVDGAGRKDLERQGLQELRNEDSLVGIQGVVGKALLRIAADQGHDRYIGDFAARPTCRRDEDEFLFFFHRNLAIE